MIPLILFVLLGIVILIIFEVRARKEKNNVELLNNAEQATDVATEQRSEDDGCCGEHLVCERETLLQTNAQIEYFDDEELDELSGIAAEDYTKEQSGAYVDWQKQSNAFSADAEQKAAAGMSNTGFSESSKVGMWNTYQNRIASAREAYSRAVLNYDNAIKDARLQNNSVLAEIAFGALQQQLELSLQGFQYKNQLLLDKTNQKLTLENTYYQRYQDVLNQINTENALAEQIRQFNEQMAEDIRQFNIIHGGGGSGGSGGSSRSSDGNGGPIVEGAPSSIGKGVTKGAKTALTGTSSTQGATNANGGYWDTLANRIKYYLK